ncbi:N-methylhydantoinase A [Rhodothalassium salexigens DSM 2132]|uniref:N-methylhydantoinase A n=1 Tax=Rhodothalassium salexigens DSM 2132 TaxID=1188247 RepID=A0A4R2PAL5_RHOSA|nr:hydantoinase/oxoprolinase family protein [Rhodothalassium salexigens]MBB4212347.1 N-methylhydantoinase A [Rhodothalassium salexigens DSM 2132]MBK1637771.1 5-oxoprolinase [Rhodothalassium salexigens DSM 2132]TCP32022.1 N-methylhydantoinase A [Rhodothalassium salexigens DSM 2132]
MTQIRAASDVGGTFTDLVYYEIDDRTGEARHITEVKAHTTPPNFQQGVMDALDKAGIDARQMAFFAHGSTVVINTLTERKGAAVGLITTQGFRDVLEIARGNRPDFFNLLYEKPAPFVPRHLRREVAERMTYKGEVAQPLALDASEDSEGLDAILDHFRAEGVEAIAICLLHAYANPAHEQALAQAIAARWPEVAVVASHQICREWREYERTNTAVLNAYVQPRASAYLTQLQDALTTKGFDGAFYVMQSNGGIDTVEAARRTPITIVESGPASGVLGAAALGELLGVRNLIAFDIGGTTAKCSLVDDGQVSLTSQYMIERDDRSAGYPIMTPVVDIVEIGNGGGSIGWIDDFGKLHVGPQSAGADPGPVAYGRGGRDATTTDANLMLGRVNPDYFIGGEVKADMAAVEAAFARLGQPLGLDAVQAARGVIRIANHNMANALKLVSINRGYDPRDFALVAFGGGGGMHAAALAEELNIPSVIVPAKASVFSAWGMLMSDLRRDYVQTHAVAMDAHAADGITDALGALRDQALAAYADEGVKPGRVRFDQALELRYVGQAHTVKVAFDHDRLTADDIDRVLADFHTAYEKTYTYALDNPVELVSLNLTAFAAIDKPTLPKLATTDDPAGALNAARKPDRRVDFDAQGVHQTAIYDRDRLPAGTTFTGPAIVEEAGTTTVVLPGQRVRVDDYGNLHIETGKATA